MSTVGKVTEDIINRSPFLREAMTENLINVSALSRKIQPELEDILGKKIKEGAIVMAIKRMSPGYYYHVDVKIRNFISSLGDFLVRSDLEDFTYKNSDTLVLKQSEIMKTMGNQQDHFYTFCHGVGESTIITSNAISPKLLEIFKGEQLKSNTKNLASITIKLPSINTEISGIYYYILKHLAWEGINLVEVVSTANEFTFVVSDNDVDSAFSVLMQLKKSSKQPIKK